MENQVQNAAPQQGSDEAALEALFDKYKKRDEKKKRLSKEEILAKYFNPRQDTEIFRALPKIGQEDLIEEGWFHKVQAGKYIKNSTAVYCPAKNNPKVQAKDVHGELQVDQQGRPVMVNQYCPLCAKSAKMRSKMDKSIQGKKKEQLTSPSDLAIFEKNKGILTASNKFEAKLYYIVRGIDRGAEKDGVKFWRFKHNFKNQGVHDKLWKPIIQGYYKASGKVYNDVENGIDLVISVIDNSMPGSNVTYRDVSSIIPRYPASKLHSDPMIAKSWLDDKTTWREVFKPKKAPGIDETQYLALAAEEREVGQQYDMRNTPFYDEEAKKWIFPNHPDLELAANTRTQNLDATEEMDMPDEGEGYVGAVTTLVNQTNSPDITQMSTAAPSQTAITPQTVGAESIGAQTQAVGVDPYGDLPF